MPLMVAHSSQRILWASDQWFLFDDSYIITWTRYNWWDGDDVLFVLEQHISWIFIVLADWNNTCRSTWTHYSDYEPPSLYLDTLGWLWATQSMLLFFNTKMLHREAWNTNLISLWFDSARVQTHNLPHSRQEH
jgi:hypothetical protein